MTLAPKEPRRRRHRRPEQLQADAWDANRCGWFEASDEDVCPRRLTRAYLAWCREHTDREEQLEEGALEAEAEAFEAEETRLEEEARKAEAEAFEAEETQLPGDGGSFRLDG